ncbi:MAG: PKD domain-containing protein [Bacteroidota bacterium]
MRMRIAILMCSLCGMALGLQGQASLGNFLNLVPTSTVRICGANDTLFLPANVIGGDVDTLEFIWINVPLADTIQQGVGLSSLYITQDAFTNNVAQTLRLIIEDSQDTILDSMEINIRRSDLIAAPDVPLITEEWICTGMTSTSSDSMFDVVSGSGYTAGNLHWAVLNAGGSSRQEFSYLNSGNSSSALQPGQTVYLLGRNSVGCLSSIDVETMGLQSMTLPNATDRTYCQDEASDILEISNLDNSFSLTWFNMGGSSLAPSFTPPTNVAPATLQYSVEAEKNGCASERDTAVITILANPGVSFSSPLPQEICLRADPITLPFSNTVPNVNQTWRVASNDSVITTFNPIGFPLGNNTLTLELNDPNGCSRDFDAEISVLYQAEDTLFASRTAICAGETVTLRADTTPVISAYRWYRDSVQISGNIDSIIISLPGTYYAEIDGESPCITSTESIEVTVRDLPAIDFGSDSVISEACLNGDTLLLPLIASGTFASQDWESPSTNSVFLQNAFYPPAVGTGDQAIDITFTLIDTEGCKSDSSFSVFVHNPPEVNFSVDADTICLREASTFSNSTSPGDATYAWDFGDTSNGSTETNPTHTYQNPGSFDVLLVAVETATGCSDSSSQSVNVQTLPTNSVGMLDPRCYNEPSFALPTPPSGVSYVWESPVNGDMLLPRDVAGLDSLNSVNENLRVYIVDNATQCQDSFAIPITILPRPVAGFTYVPFCFTEPAIFTDASSFGGDLTYLWSFEEGGTIMGFSTDQNPSYEFQAGLPNPGETDFEVSLTVTANGNCQDTYTETVMMNNTGPARSGIEWLSNDILVATDGSATSYQWYRSCNGGPFEPINEVSDAVGDNLGQRQFYHVSDPSQLDCKFLVETTNDDPNGCSTLSLPFNERRPASLPDEYGLDLFPNPNQGTFTFSLYHPADGEVNLQVFDQLGRQVYMEKMIKDRDLQQKSLELIHLESGVYFVAVQIGRNHRFIQKMIIQ